MEKHSNDKKALKSGVWYTVCNFLVKGAVFLSTPLFTRMMSTQDIGAFANITAWVNILTVFTSLELFTSIALAKYEYPGQLDQYISSIFGLSLIVTSFFYAVAWMIKPHIEQFLGMDSLAFHLVFIFCIVSPAIHMIQAKNRVTYQYKSSTVLSLCSVFSSIVFAILLVIKLQDKLEGRLIGYYGSLIVFYSFIGVFLIYKGRGIYPKYWRFALTISIPMVIHGLSGQLLSSCDRIMIKNICGNSMNALYSIAYTGATVISVLWTSLNTAWSPWSYDQMSNKGYKKLRRASKPYVILFFIIVVAFLLIAPEIMMIMGGEKYLEAVVVMPPVVIGMFFQFVYSLYVNIEIFNKKQKYTAIGTSIAAILNIILNWLLIPKFGYVAAAYTTLIGYITLFIIHYLIVCKMKMQWYYDSKYNLLLLALSLILIPLSLYLYNHNPIRWIIVSMIVLSCAVLAIKNRQVIVQVVKARSLAPLKTLAG